MNLWNDGEIRRNNLSISISQVQKPFFYLIDIEYKHLYDFVF